MTRAMASDCPFIWYKSRNSLRFKAVIAATHRGGRTPGVAGRGSPGQFARAFLVCIWSNRCNAAIRNGYYPVGHLCNGHALLLATGELRGEVIEALAEADKP
jgi:hypothetical protein